MVCLVEEVKALEENFNQKYLPLRYKIFKKQCKEGRLEVKSKIEILEDHGCEIDLMIKRNP